MNFDSVISIEAEQGVIGSLLFDGSGIDRITAPLRVEHFSRDGHRIIFGTITELLQAGKPADIVTVHATLEERGLDRVVGGLVYLAEVASSMPSSANIHRYAEIVVEKAQLRALLASSRKIEEVVADRSLSTPEKLSEAQSIIQGVTEEALTQSAPERLSSILGQHLNIMDDRLNGKQDAISTGFNDLDKNLNGGIREGQLIYVAGRPAMGKSSFALQISLAIAKIGPVLFCSQEMPKRDVADRIYAVEASIPLDSLLSGMNNDQWDAATAAAGRLAKTPLFIDEQPSLRFSDIASKARLVRRQAGGIKAVVIDYLQLMAGKGDNRNAEIEKISRSLKQLAKELNAPVIALSQLNREVEKRPNKRPLLSDLRDSGSIEQDADIVIMLYRDEVYIPQTLDKGTAEILIRKNRQGKTGEVRLSWRGECAAFGNLDYDSWNEQKQDEIARRATQAPMKKKSKGFDDA